MRIFPITAGAAMLACSCPALGQQLRPLVDPPASADAAREGVDVFLLNEGTAPVAAQAPVEIEATARDGTPLRLVGPPGATPVIRPGGFARVRYRLAGAETPAPDIVPAPAGAPAGIERIATDSSGSSGAFPDRFRTHAPVYGAFGLADAGGKLQLSFAFRALGEADGPDLSFAYTQTMFWALGEPSGPFRATNYSPELFVDLPLDRATVLGAGYRHDSNGLGVAGSIDVNRVFARATRRVDLGGGWRADLTPEAWAYVGRQGEAPDLERYWGYGALTAAIGRADGIKLAVTARGNPGTGKGAAEAFLSYPLARIWQDLPHAYLFGEAFAGYGEALTDYDRRDHHARLGIAFTR